MTRMRNGLLLLLSVIVCQWAAGAGVCLAQENHSQPYKTTVAAITSKIRGNVWKSSRPKAKPRPDVGLAIIAGKKRYLTTRDTKVYDRGGRLITMAALPVPCEAKIEYQPLRRGRKNVITIRVIRSLSGARSGWAAPQPE